MVVLQIEYESEYRCTEYEYRQEKPDVHDGESPSILLTTAETLSEVRPAAKRFVWTRHESTHDSEQPPLFPVTNQKTKVDKQNAAAS